jgi:hypothetical protein
MATEGKSADRRDALLKLLCLGGVGAGSTVLGVWLKGRSRRPEERRVAFVEHRFTVPPDANLPEVVVAQGEDPAALVRKSIEELGGIRRFISRGDVVGVKPNIAWDRTPEQAANTSPQVVAEVVQGLPKTRSGKILRGTMQKIADGDDYKTPATIDDAGALTEVREALKQVGYAKNHERHLSKELNRPRVAQG